MCNRHRSNLSREFKRIKWSQRLVSRFELETYIVDIQNNGTSCGYELSKLHYVYVENGIICITLWVEILCARTCSLRVVPTPWNRRRRAVKMRWTVVVWCNEKSHAFQVFIGSQSLWVCVLLLRAVETIDAQGLTEFNMLFSVDFVSFLSCSTFRPFDFLGCGRLAACLEVYTLSYLGLFFDKPAWYSFASNKQPTKLCIL